MTVEDDHAPTAGFELVRIAGGTSAHRSRPSYSGHHRSQSSISEAAMTTIDEDREQDFSDTRRLTKASVNAAEHEPAQSGYSPSVLRRLSTKLRMGASGHRSRSFQRRDYATVEESSSEYGSVDLSSLEGLGVQLREVPNTGRVPSEPLEEEDTFYRGAQNEPYKPSFAEFRKRQSLGSGMVIGAQLQRDPSLLDRPGAPENRDDKIRRMQTVRQVGKNLAEERGQMVAYSEAIDLSSLEGAGLRLRQSTTFDDMTFSRANTMPDTKSYFFPSDPDIPNWKPFSMRSPWMIMLASIAFGLAAFQEILCQKSQKRQRENPKSALLAFDSVDDVSVGMFFVWKYMPTMVTIVYSVLYSIMDFDIRRLEPYYQLSKPQGARAAASLNLDHLTMFQYFVPFNAARLGQWAVFASTFANIIAATVAPAFQNPSVNFQPNPLCAPGQQCPEGAGQRFWVLIAPVWSRLLTTSYVIIGLVVVFLFFQIEAFEILENMRFGRH